MLLSDWQRYLDSALAPAAAGPGLAWVPELAVVTFRGADALTFLQGYLTCDTEALQPGQPVPTALCNLKGRVVVNGWCALPAVPADSPAVRLIVHDSLRTRLGEFLKPYLAFSRTRLDDTAAAPLVLSGLDLADPVEVDAGVEMLTLDARRRLFLCPTLDAARALWQRCPAVAAEAWRYALCADGIPLLSAEVSETFLPQMLNLDTLGAVDFAKGCYLGQEVVARAQHRGQVKRRLAVLDWQGRQPAAGSEITDAEGRGQGTVVQSAAHADGAGRLLAVLREGLSSTGAGDAGEDAANGLRQADAVLTPVR